MKKLCFAVVYLALVLAGYGQMVSGVQVNGTVISDSGILIAGATIVALPADSLVNPQMTLTNSAGEFSLTVQQSGNYFFHVSSPGFQSINQGPIFIGEPLTLSFVLSGNITYQNLFSGAVFDTLSGLPIPGAFINLMGINSGFILTEVTGPDGKFLFTDISPGTYSIRVDAPGYDSYYSNQMLTITQSSQIQNYFVHLFPYSFGSTEIFGRTLSESPGPNGAMYVPYAGVTLSNSGMAISVNSDASGFFIFSNVPAGNYYIVASAPGYLPTVPEEIIANGDSIYKEIILQPEFIPDYGRIQGTVISDDTGEPLSEILIGCIPVNQPGFFTSFLTGPDGSFELSVLPGDYLVSAEYGYFNNGGPYNYREYFDNVVNIGDAAVISVLENSTITGIDFGLPDIQGTAMDVLFTGKVTDDEGAPIEGATVTYINLSSMLTVVYQTNTNINGDYTLLVENVAAPMSEFRAAAVHPGYQEEYWNNKPAFFLADPIMVFAGQDSVISGIDFSLSVVQQTNNGISGTVYDHLGNHLSGSFIAVFGSDNNRFGYAVSDSSGNYLVAGLPEGFYYVLFYSAGHIPQFYNQALEWENATPVFLLGNISGIDAYLGEEIFANGAGLLSGKITDQSGIPVSGVMVAVKDISGSVIRSAMTDASGNYALSGLEMQNYTLIATKVNYQTFTHDLSMGDGGASTKVINLTLISVITSIKEDSDTDAPLEYRLSQNYPNPFNPVTKISYAVPVNEKGIHTLYSVNLKVYDVLGNIVADLVQTHQPAGSYSVNFDASNLSSGIYFYRLDISGANVRNFSDIKKMVLLR